MPFGTLHETICARFRMMHAPAFPLSYLLQFWGGVENGFNAFAHNPEDYAKAVHCPTLLLYGAEDDRVTRKEIDAIYHNLDGEKRLVTFPLAGHNDYLLKYQKEWTLAVDSFLQVTR